MDSCEVLIVGGGPAGSSCAKRLREAGIETVILDKATFPRDKVCGGWITPAVVEELGIDLAEYARGRVLQPITGFRISRMGDADVKTDYGQAVSYGVRRFEFDDYLLRRSGARLILGKALSSVERAGDGWIVTGEVTNGGIRARMLIGAGGHFCPVARHLGASARKEEAVAAQEIEFENDRGAARGLHDSRGCSGTVFLRRPEGLRMVLSQGRFFLNIGLGRLDAHSLPGHVSEFVQGLNKSGKIGFDLPAAMRGHAYLIFRETKRPVVGDGVLLIGDAGGAGVFAERRGDTTRRLNPVCLRRKPSLPLVANTRESDLISLSRDACRRGSERRGQTGRRASGGSCRRR